MSARTTVVGPDANVVIADAPRTRRNHTLADSLAGSSPASALRQLRRYVADLARRHRFSGPAVEDRQRLTPLDVRFDDAVDLLKRRPPVGIPRPGQQAREELHDLHRHLCRPSSGGVAPALTPSPTDFPRRRDGSGLDVVTAARIHPAIDLANVTLSFPFAWYGFDLPVMVRVEMVADYRRRMGTSHGVEGLHLAHALIATMALGTGGPAAEADEPLVTGARPVAVNIVRARLLLQLDRALESDPIVRDLPALATWLDDARLRLVDAWPMVAPLPIVPALRHRPG